jgi:hypothetical protein
MKKICNNRVKLINYWILFIKGIIMKGHIALLSTLLASSATFSEPVEHVPVFYAEGAGFYSRAEADFFTTTTATVETAFRQIFLTQSLAGKPSDSHGGGKAAIGVIVPVAPNVSIDGQVNLRLQKPQLHQTNVLTNASPGEFNYRGIFTYNAYVKDNSVAPGGDAFLKINFNDGSPFSVAVGGGAFYQKVNVYFDANQNYNNITSPSPLTSTYTMASHDKWVTVLEAVARVFYDVNENASIFAGVSYGESIRDEYHYFHVNTLDDGSNGNGVVVTGDVNGVAKVGLKYTNVELGARWTFADNPPPVPTK